MERKRKNKHRTVMCVQVAEKQFYINIYKKETMTNNIQCLYASQECRKMQINTNNAREHMNHDWIELLKFIIHTTAFNKSVNLLV